MTDAIVGEMTNWMARPLERIYPVVFIDAMGVNLRDGRVTNRPTYTAIGVTVDGRREILGLWAGTGGEGAKFWLQVLTEIKNRGTEDVCIVVCNGLEGFPMPSTPPGPSPSCRPACCTPSATPSGSPAALTGTPGARDLLNRPGFRGGCVRRHRETACSIPTS